MQNQTRMIFFYNVKSNIKVFNMSLS